LLNCFANPWDDFMYPPSDGDVFWCRVVHAVVEEPGSTVIEDSGGQFVDPLVDRAPDPSAVGVAGPSASRVAAAGPSDMGPMML
jgi:hypothetical protein